MNEILGAIIERTLAIIRVPTGMHSEEAREQMEALKLFYQFIKTIVFNNIASVILSDKNISSAETVLKTILLGLDNDDIQVIYTDIRLIIHIKCIFTQCHNIINNMKVKRLCIEIMHRLVALWGGDGTTKEPLPGFKAFVIKEVLPLLFKTILHPGFNPDDAYSNSVCLLSLLITI